VGGIQRDQAKDDSCVFQALRAAPHMRAHNYRLSRPFCKPAPDRRHSDAAPIARLASPAPKA